MWYLLGLIFVAGSSIASFFYLNPQFGGRVTKKNILKYQSSSHWNGAKFENLIPTSMNITPKVIPKLLRDQFSGRKDRGPAHPLPILPVDKDALASLPEVPKFIWFGHATLLLQLGGTNLLIDPMFGPDASPIAPFTAKRFSENTLDLIDQLPKIDAVLMTHDHYDHLDYKSILKLQPYVPRYYVALGVSRHLERWGVPADQITELDWWDQFIFEGIEITFTPSRHFSGRGLTDRFKCLWGGFVFKTPAHQIYWSGDGGYGDHFKQVAGKFGPFDWAFMECGQYNEYWHDIHMFPEESVRASMDVHARIAIPVHWGAFTLALHNWKEPAERFVREAHVQHINSFTPKLGETVLLGNENIHDHWWE